MTLLRIADIRDCVAAEFGLAGADLAGRTRRWDICRARHVAMKLARECTAASLPAIGRQFGARSHSTVLRAVNAVARRAETDAALRRQLARLRRALAARARALARAQKSKRKKVTHEHEARL